MVTLPPERGTLRDTKPTRILGPFSEINWNHPTPTLQKQGVEIGPRTDTEGGIDAACPERVGRVSFEDTEGRGSGVTFVVVVGEGAEGVAT